MGKGVWFYSPVKIISLKRIDKVEWRMQWNSGVKILPLLVEVKEQLYNDKLAVRILGIYLKGFSGKKLFLLQLLISAKSI